MLAPGGLIGLVSLTHGTTGLAQQIERVWMALHRSNPARVGGCRPLELGEHLAPSAWRVRHQEVVTHLGISSEVLVAERNGD